MPFLGALASLDLINVWDDRKIDGGDFWYQEIKAALEQAEVAICLISANYLSSYFITKEEVPNLLERREKEHLLLVPLLLSESPWRLFPWIRETQLLPRDARPLDSMTAPKRNKVLNDLAELIAARLEGRAKRQVRGEPQHRSGAAPETVDISRLPVTGAELFGRTEELRWLDDQWKKPAVRVASLVAWGGVGKSTLVSKWLERMAADSYHGARRVFGWSFYSQGTSVHATSADMFLEEALRFFGDSGPTKGSPWSKGERLAKLVFASRNLLVLDGLEPLQSPTNGQVQDPGLGQLLRSLVRPTPENTVSEGELGLCVITSRQRVTDLDGFPAVATTRDLEEIDSKAGRALLRVRGVRGSDSALEKVARDFGCHALAITLVASFIQEVTGHPASAAAGIPDLKVPVERGKHARRVLEAFVRHFGPSPERELLLLLGLFDRPAAIGALAALRTMPTIPGLTDRLAGLSETEWHRLLRKLRTLRLIAEEDRHQLEIIDAHPLVREHFGESLEKENPKTWRKGHWRLFQFYSQGAGHLPDTADGLEPLFAAVYHGCKAGKHKKVYEDVYWQRIQRRSEFFAVKQLGLLSGTLQALGSFFRVRWSEPVVGLTAILSQAGGFLQALGQIREAVKPRKAALAFFRSRKSFDEAASEARNLSFAYLALGEIGKARTAARLSVKLSHNDQQRRWSFAAIGASLHYSGLPDQAEGQFRLAERSLKNCEPDQLFLYGFAGFQYSELLLDRGASKDVLERAEVALEIATRKHLIRDIALNHLSIGRSYLIAAPANGRLDLNRANQHLEFAVDELRRAGQLVDLPRGLLARAELRYLAKDLRGAEDDLEQSLDICIRAGLCLLEADTHLMYTRLHLADHNAAAARASLDHARALIEQTNYHRRARDVAEMKTALAKRSTASGYRLSVR